MKTIVYACLLASVIFPATSSGQEHSCGKLKSMVEKTKCLDRHLEAAEAALDKALEAALAKYSPTAQHEDLSATPQVKQVVEEEDRLTVQALKDSQRYWLAFRDNSCAAVEHMYEGGTAASEAVPDCRLELTDQRIHWIETKFGKEQQRKRKAP